MNGLISLALAGYPSAPWLSPGAVPHFQQSMGVPAGVTALVGIPH
jgi:hypothetical protein